VCHRLACCANLANTRRCTDTAVHARCMRRRDKHVARCHYVNLMHSPDPRYAHVHVCMFMFPPGARHITAVTRRVRVCHLIAPGTLTRGRTGTRHSRARRTARSSPQARASTSSATPSVSDQHTSSYG
jgi:hypothetical protein